jgi:hypothetical protein
LLNFVLGNATIFVEFFRNFFDFKIVGIFF